MSCTQGHVRYDDFARDENTSPKDGVLIKKKKEQGRHASKTKVFVYLQERILGLK